MARIFIKKVGEYQNLYCDNKTGIAWIEDGSTGLGHSCHPSIDASGSVSEMKNLGYWDKSDRVVTSHGFKYNIDRFIVDTTNPLDRIVARECMCQACIERRRLNAEKINRIKERL